MSERTPIAAAAVAGLQALDDDLPIQEDANIQFSPPQDRSWARISFQDGGASRASFGGVTGNLERGPVLAYCDIFTLLGDGDGEAKDLAEAVKDAWRDLTALPLRFDHFNEGPEGIVDGWWRKQIVAVFRRSVRV